MGRRKWSFANPTGSDFNEISARLDWASEGQAGLASNVRKLYTLDREQEREIAELRMVVEELSALLVSMGIFNEKQLLARVSSRLAASHQQDDQTPAQDRIHCASCGTSILKSDTYFSETGEVCSACFSG